MSSRLGQLALVAVLAFGCRPSVRPPEPARRMQIFLLAGQSNMAGRGAVEPEDRVVVPRVLMLDRAGQWVPATEPMHFDKPIAGVGPGRAFGIAVAERDSTIVVGLVPVAVGGTSITWWEPGAQDPATKAFPYDDAIRRARIAVADGELAGILWHQGEGDSNAQAAPGYAERLRVLIERFRTDLGAPNVPFIVGQLGQFPEKPWTEWRIAVDSIHRALPSQDAHSAYVSAANLGHRGDTLHFDSRSARELGRRYAAAYFSLRDASRAQR